MNDYQRRLWMRPNARLWIREDAHRYRRGPNAVKFNPDQPRVPGGNSDGGQWTNSENTEGDRSHILAPQTDREDLSPEMQLASVIRVCIPVGISIFGDGTYAAMYECFGGRTFRRTGVGRPPGIVRDPFALN